MIVTARQNGTGLQLWGRQDAPTLDIYDQAFRPNFVGDPFPDMPNLPLHANGNGEADEVYTWPVAGEVRYRRSTAYVTTGLGFGPCGWDLEDHVRVDPTDPGVLPLTCAIRSCRRVLLYACVHRTAGDTWAIGDPDAVLGPRLAVPSHPESPPYLVANWDFSGAPVHSVGRVSGNTRYWAAATFEETYPTGARVFELVLKYLKRSPQAGGSESEARAILDAMFPVDASHHLLIGCQCYVCCTINYTGGVWTKTKLGHGGYWMDIRFSRSAPVEKGGA
jgi:hypothetical protein